MHAKRKNSEAFALSLSLEFQFVKPTYLLTFKQRKTGGGGWAKTQMIDGH
jgi:hypothetical protein